MRISNLNLVSHSNLIRLNARVIWEDCDQPQRDIYIETEKRFENDLSLNPHAFLVGCMVPAMHFAEKRILLPHAVCPTLKEGLHTVMALMELWSKGGMKPLKIESKSGYQSEYAHKPRRAGLFLSGGIDSLAALSLNRLNYPGNHPGAVKDCLLVHGFDIGGVMVRGAKLDVFERAKKALASVAEDAGVTLIPVYTNIRHLCDDRDLWLDKFFGAVLAAVAHGFAARLGLLYIAASYSINHLVPCGSHPLLDPEFSSHDVRIRHRDLALTRIDKLNIVASWEPAFQHFRVCLANVKDRLNCGRCEKCVRTMLGLLALGLLDKTRAFAEDDVSPDFLSAFKITIRHRDSFYRELIPLLKRRGRLDLVTTIEEKLSTGQ